MASLSEMMQYAQAQQPRNGLAEIAGNFVKGAGDAYFDEKKYQRDQKAKQLDSLVKIMDIQEKMASMKQKELENQYMTWNMKSQGILPPDEKDIMTARTVAGESIGADVVKSKPNSAAGRLQSNFENQFGGMDVEITLGPKGITRKYTTPKADKERPNKTVELNQKILKEAEAMAQRDLLETMARTPGPDGQPMYVPGVHDPKKFVPPQEQIDSYIPLARARMTGDDITANNIGDKLRASRDPLGPVQPKKKGLAEIGLNALRSIMPGGN